MKYRAPIIAVVLIVLFGVAFFFLLWQPKDEELEEVRQETAQLEAQRGQLQNELRRLQEIEEREPEFRAALARLEEYIPSGPAQATAIRQFQMTADAAGVSIDTVSFSTPAAIGDAPPTGTPDTVLAQITVSMNVSGGYFQVVDFFRRLEVDVPRAILLQSLSQAAGADGFPVLNSSWAGTMFAVVPDPDVVGVEPPPEPDPDDADIEIDAEIEIDEDGDDA